MSGTSRRAHSLIAIAAVGVMAIAPASREWWRTPPPPGDGPSATEQLSGCALLLPGSDTATSSDCLSCHRSLGRAGHPFDLDYARWGGVRGPITLRPIAEAIGRGAFLPDGQLRCVTCHARTSPWKFHIRLPAGTKPTHAVDRQRPETYERPEILSSPVPGDAVGTKPLCVACHALD